MAGLFILVMDGVAEETAVGGGFNEARDGIDSNSGTATRIRQATSIPLSKKRYKKLGIAKCVVDYLI
jgi:hypothetical protein